MAKEGGHSFDMLKGDGRGRGLIFFTSSLWGGGGGEGWFN